MCEIVIPTKLLKAKQHSTCRTCWHHFGTSNNYQNDEISNFSEQPMTEPSKKRQVSFNLGGENKMKKKVNSNKPPGRPINSSYNTEN